MTSEAERECYRCHRRKPDGAFIQRIDDRHYRMCRACVSEIMLARPERKERLAHTATERTCYLCRRILPVSEFTRRSNGTFFSACKGCNRHVFAQRRRARLKAVGGSYSVAEWITLAAQYDRCPMCLRMWGDIKREGSTADVITADHIIPISRGGANSIENIQPLCFSCNSKKGAKDPRP